VDERCVVRRLQVVERLQQREAGAAARIFAVERRIGSDERLLDAGERGLANGLRRERHDRSAGAHERGEQRLA